MTVSVSYSNWVERQSIVATKEAEGLTMLRDDYAPKWKPGQEPRGTLTFTDEPRPSALLPEPPLSFETFTHGLPDKVSRIEEFLKRAYPKK